MSEGRGTLAVELTNAMRRRIVEGEFRPGDKLPSEKAIVETAKVSRTVVREAIAALRAEGLITVRHGVGVFVASSEGTRRLQLTSADFEDAGDRRAMQQMRLAIEAEMAALAARTRTPEQLDALRDAYGRFGSAISAGGNGRDEDQAFHLALAEASGNTYFARFVAFAGADLIPGAPASSGNGAATLPEAKLKTIHLQHHRILKAVETRDEDAAREALRAHLELSGESAARPVMDRASA